MSAYPQAADAPSPNPTRPSRNSWIASMTTNHAPSATSSHFSMKTAAVQNRKALFYAVLALAMLAHATSVQAQSGTLPPAFIWQFSDSNGDPLSLGSIESFLAGTNTHEPIYSNQGLSSAYTNPYTLPASGKLTFYLTPGKSYKFIIKNSAGNTVDTIDNIPAIPASASNQDIAGTAGENLVADDVVYLSDGSGSKTAGQWYKADADLTYASTAPVIAFALTALDAGVTGSFRLAGTVELAGPLTPGSSYYVSATAGEVTSTMPPNTRFLGIAQSATVLIVTPNPSANALSTSASALVADGRLTLTSATPVTITDVTAATSVYYTPYAGNRISLYNGSVWQTLTFSELTLAVPATTTTLYDVFAYNNSGTVALEALAWTNDTTRATALVLQDGVLVKTGATTRRYLGSFRTTGVSGQTEDSQAKRYLWNYYHRVSRQLRVVDTTDTWTYNTNTFRQANNAAANQLDVVIGVAEVMLNVQVNAIVADGSGVASTQYVAIGEDSTTTAASNEILIPISDVSTSLFRAPAAFLRKQPAAGRHTYVWLEKANTTGNSVWRGDGGDAAMQVGISGWIEG